MVPAPLVAQKVLGAGVPQGKLTAWMRVNNPLERYMADYKRTFDAWQDGGVRGIAIGRMYFVEPDGAQLPVFPANPQVYASYGVEPPAPTPRNLEKEKLLRAMLDDMAGRGWEILFFSNPRMGGSRPVKDDPFQVIGFAAGIEDTMRAFPQAKGVVIDGAGEHHYELAFHHGGELFEMRDGEKRRC